MQQFTSLSQMLKTSSLDEMLDCVQSQIKIRPDNLQMRDILFRLYCIEGQWERALLQLQTLALLDSGLTKKTELYKNLVFSEIQRVQVLSGERQPVTLNGDMTDWMLQLHQANMLQQEQSALADIIRAEAFDLAQASAGQSDTLGVFNWIADSDGRLGPTCEFICAGGYRWVPFSSVQTMRVSKPTDLLDLIWLSTTLTVDGERYYGFVPARYPVHSRDEQDIKLGIKTEWTELSTLLSSGHGRKVFITDVNEHAIMELGNVVFR